MQGLGFFRRALPRHRETFDCHLGSQTEGQDEPTDSVCQQTEEPSSKINYPEVPTRTLVLTSLVPSQASGLFPRAGSMEKSSEASKELVHKALDPAEPGSVHAPSG